MEEISWQEFEKVALRAGTITEVLDFPEARKPAYKIKVSFGPYGDKWTSAQVTQNYTRETLLNKQIIGVINFPKKQIGKFMSEFLLTGFSDEKGHIVIATTASKVPDGASLI